MGVQFAGKMLTEEKKAIKIKTFAAMLVYFLRFDEIIFRHLFRASLINENEMSFACSSLNPPLSSSRAYT